VVAHTGKLEWWRHVIRMDETRVAKESFELNQKLEVKWEHPRLSWIQHVEDYLRELKVKRWRQNSNNLS
jgi:hypothetical protein